MCSVHRTVMPSCGGRHTSRIPTDDRSTPVRDRTGRRGNRVCPRRPHRARPRPTHAGEQPERARPRPHRPRRRTALRRSRPPAGAGRRTDAERSPRACRHPTAWSSAPCPRPPGWPARCSCSRGLAGVAAPFPTYLVVGGHALSQATGVGGALVALLVPLLDLAVGASSSSRGAVPKFGLAYAGVAGALAVGQLLIELYRGSSSTARPGDRGDRRPAGAHQRHRGGRRLGARRRGARASSSPRASSPRWPGVARSWRTAARSTPSARAWPVPLSCSAWSPS